MTGWRSGGMAMALLYLVVSACAGDGGAPATPSAPAAGATAPSESPATSAAPPPVTAPPDPAPAEPPAPEWVEVRYRLEDRSRAPGDTAFTETVQQVLTSPRGWARARYRFVADPAAAYRILLAEADEVDRLCLPLDTMATYSCQNGPVVALNADRWRTATPEWTGDLASYRVMLINHEVGHLLHLHHPRPQCPGPGLPAPVMAQQSTELGDCLANPWPLQWEIDLALRRAEPLAPPAEHDPSDHRPTAPPAGS